MKLVKETTETVLLSDIDLEEDFIVGVYEDQVWHVNRGIFCSKNMTVKIKYGSTIERYMNGGHSVYVAKNSTDFMNIIYWAQRNCGEKMPYIEGVKKVVTNCNDQFIALDQCISEYYYITRVNNDSIGFITSKKYGEPNQYYLAALRSLTVGDHYGNMKPDTLPNLLEYLLKSDFEVYVYKTLQDFTHALSIFSNDASLTK